MTAPGFNLRAEIERETAAYLSLEGIAVPISIRKPAEITYSDLLDALLSLDELSASDWEEKYRPMMEKLKELDAGK